ncbi:MAG: hypothetical protein AzoDbin1_05160 [Azoarcus sp.]|nr:hypothetical protein [Azoarcus sp.]
MTKYHALRKEPPEIGFLNDDARRAGSEAEDVHRHQIGAYRSYSARRFLPRESEEHENDPCAATRRAIVRAAAEVGRRMIEENKA